MAQHVYQTSVTSSSLAITGRLQARCVLWSTHCACTRHLSGIFYQLQEEEAEEEEGEDEAEDEEEDEAEDEDEEEEEDLDEIEEEEDEESQYESFPIYRWTVVDQ